MHNKTQNRFLNIEAQVCSFGLVKLVCIAFCIMNVKTCFIFLVRGLHGIVRGDCLNIRQNFVTVKVITHFKRLSREVAESPYLYILKIPAEHSPKQPAEPAFSRGSGASDPQRASPGSTLP